MSIKRTLEQHLQEKHINHFWLTQVLHEKNGETYFPYQPTISGAKVGSRANIVPDNHTVEHPVGSQRKPMFLINIPVAHLPQSKGYEKINQLVTALKTESFGYNSQNSQKQAIKKLAVVIGVNQIKSIDQRVNRRFEKYISEMPEIDGICCQVFGFFWNPAWTENDKWKKGKVVEETLKKKKFSAKVHDKRKAFLLLKCVNPAKAKEVRHVFEGSSKGISFYIREQIPFQKIRERIKDSEATKVFARKMAEKSETSPLLFMTMDGDVAKLRTQLNGYFSTYEEIMAKTKREKGYYPSVLSLGYQLADTALPIPKFAVKCDMVVRAAMNRIIPGSVYMPEPGTAYYLSRGGQFVSNLEALSFVDGKKKGENGLESRRAITNGIEKGILDQSRMVFEPNGALQTAMPGRMKTKAVEKYDTLTRDDFKKKEVYKALRGVSQVHFSPLDWAHNLTEGLPKEARAGQGGYQKVSGILSRVFNVFDPITFIYNFPTDEAFSEKVTDALTLHEVYTTNLIDGERNNKVVKVRNRTCLKLDDTLKPYDDYLQGQFSVLITAKNELLTRLDAEWVKKIIDAARASGKALCAELKKAAQV